jgi:hypothetical protein
MHLVLPPHFQLQVTQGCEPNSHVPSVQSMSITHTISLRYLNFDRHKRKYEKYFSKSPLHPHHQILLSLTSTMSQPQLTNG